MVIKFMVTWIGSVCPHLDVLFPQSKLCEILKNQYSSQKTNRN